MKTINKALAAIFVVAAMCLAPLSVVDSADADFEDADAGWSYRMDDPTDAELTEFDVNKSEVAGESLIILMNWIRLSLFGTPTSCTMNSFYLARASGMDVDSESYTEMHASEIKIKGLELEVMATGSGKIIQTITSKTDEKDKAAMEAIEAYLGDVAVGDKVVITGDITYEMAECDVYSYKGIDDDSSILTTYSSDYYVVMDYDISMKLIKAGETDGKSIDFVCNLKGSVSEESEYTYDADFEDIVPSTKGRMENSESYSTSGGAHFTVDGKDYDLSTDDKSDPNPSQDIVAMYYIVDDDDIVVDEDIKITAAGMPDSTDNVKVGKKYSDADSLFSDIKKDATGKKSYLIPIIIGVVVAVVVIGGIAAFVILRKKNA